MSESLWWTQNVATTNTTTSSQSQERQSVPGSKFPDRLETRPAFQEQQALTEKLAAMPLEDKKALGFTATDFILDCQFAGATCSITDNFTEYYNPIHGNCFIFNSGWENVTLFKSYKTGPRYGEKFHCYNTFLTIVMILGIMITEEE